MSEDRPRAVLFACNLNTVRSPMAAALLARRSRGRIYAASCGVWPGGEADPFMVEVMSERGIDMSDHAPRMIDDFAGRAFDVIVAMTDESLPRVEEVARARRAKVERWRIDDPSAVGETRATRLQAYRDVRDEIDRIIRGRLEGRSSEDLTARRASRS